MVRLAVIVAFASVLVPAGGILGVLVGLMLSILASGGARPVELISVPLGAGAGGIAAVAVGAYMARLDERRDRPY